MRYLFLLLLFLTSLLASDVKLKTVSLQLLWLDQFQFAGYYMAKEKGFYKDAGFEVKLKKIKEHQNIMLDVENGITDYGIGRASLILHDSSGEKISLLAAIYQSTPNILISLKSSNIDDISDFKGKRLMQTNDLLQSASMAAMLKSKNLKLSDLTVIKHSFDLNDLLNKKVDIYSAYISNEPFSLIEKGIAFNTFSPQIEGLDFYSDILYTSKKNTQDNPQEVQRFKEASLKGWQYAFSHIEESVAVILNKYNSQKKSKEALFFEAKELKKLAFFGTKEIGTLDKAKIQRIHDIYKILGVTTAPLNSEEIIFHMSKIHFNEEEREYLKHKKFIRYCTQPNSMPYSAIKDSKFTGIGAGIINIVHQNSGIEFKLKETKSWDESVLNAINRECDILVLASDSPSRHKYFNFTYPYYSEPLVIVTKKNEHYILDINSVLDKKFSVVKGNSFVENLQLKYPHLHLTEVNNIEEAFAQLESGKVYGHINIMMSSAYAMQKYSKLNLKIAGQFDQNTEVSFAVRNDDQILFNIMNKSAKSITREDIQLILNKWISINYTKGLNYWYFKEIAIVIGLFILFMFYREYFLNKKNRELQELQAELVGVNEQLRTKAYAVTKDLEKAQSIAKIGSWVLDLESEVLTWSKQSYKIFDIDPNSKEDLYKLFRERIYPDDLDMVENEYAKSLRDRTLYSVRHRLLMNDGSIKYVNQKAETTFSDEDKPIISHGTIEDVTQKVTQALEIKKKDTYMLHQSRLAQMGEMLSMIAHQWKQPLASIAAIQVGIKTTVDLEKYDLGVEKERVEFMSYLDERLDKLELYVKNLAQTIEDFSNYYKPNKAAEFLSIDSVVMRAYELLGDSLKSSNIEVSFDLNVEYFMDVYQNELMQVIVNILNNAKDQLLENEVQKASIYIKTSVQKDEIIIEIEDNGGGISEDIMEHVFDPYFSTKEEKNGTGLGLYMSRMIINEYHNGNISVENSGQGAIFSIRIKNS